MTIPLSELEPRGIYRLWARNLIMGVWTGDEWIGIREKFGALFLDACEVPGDDTVAGSARAYEKIGELPEGLELRTNVDTICDSCGERCEFLKDPDGPRGTWVHTVYSYNCIKPTPTAPMYRPLFDYLTSIGGDPTRRDSYA